MKNDLWQSLLDAELNEKYWSNLSRKYYNREKYLKIFLASMASGTVASWGIWQEIDLIWKILSGLSAILAIALPILNFPKMIRDMSNLHQKWASIKSDYEILWLELESINRDNKDMMRIYKKIKSEENKLSPLESHLPYKKNW